MNVEKMRNALRLPLPARAAFADVEFLDTDVNPALEWLERVKYRQQRALLVRWWSETSTDRTIVEVRERRPSDG